MPHDHSMPYTPPCHEYGIYAGQSYPMDDRDAARLVLPDLDYDSQLLAIAELLKAHRSMDCSETEEIRAIEQVARMTSGDQNQQAVDDWVDHLHQFTYRDAARSTAAVGMLAPFVESLFTHTFAETRRLAQEANVEFSAHPRWVPNHKREWDCHFVRTQNIWNKNIVEGILQLASAIGLSQHLPFNLKGTLEALFEYRNRMFHGGFEWSTDDRKRFQGRLEEAGWPSNWFSKATTDGKPWMFYMTDGFIEHCLNTCNAVIDGIGAYCKCTFMGRRH